MNLQFEFSDQQMDKLEELLKTHNLDSHKDLLNTSLSFFIWATERLKQGKTIGAIDEEGGNYEQACSPSFNYIAETIKKNEFVEANQ